MEYFEIVRLRKGETRAFPGVGIREKLFVGRGSCVVTMGDRQVAALEGDVVDLATSDGCSRIVRASIDTTLIRLCGRWGESIGSSGVFSLGNSEHPVNEGDRVEYPRTTHFDNHYHDCDEYWVIFEGRVIAVSEQKLYILGPGDCLVTGMGHHHDLLQVIESLRGVYFETTFEGQRRSGHLWNHRDGEAHPRMNRI